MLGERKILQAEIPCGLRSALIANLRGVEGAIVKEEKMSASGGLLPDYVNVKHTYGYPETLRLITDALWEGMRKDGANWIVGAGHGGISIASILAKDHGLYLTLVRDRKSGHGMDSWLDGYDRPSVDDRIAFIDDVLNSGKSICEMKSRIIEETDRRGLPHPIVCGAIVVAKRGDGEKLLLDSEIPVVKYLLTREDLL